MAFIVKRDVITVPTTLPFGAATPTLYFSGLVMPDGWDGEPLSAFHHDSPYTWYNPGGFYLSAGGGNSFGWNVYGGNQWTFKGRALYDYGEGFTVEQSRTVCANSAPDGDIPLTGWVNQAGIIGTLIISTTP
jgi:hypothetical protein